MASGFCAKGVWALSHNSIDTLQQSTPLHDSEDISGRWPSDVLQQGYLQISLNNDGTMAIRGTRQLAEWLYDQLALDGWYVRLENVRWCG